MSGMNRPSDRDRKSRDRGGRPSGFRMPPPPATGLEARFYQNAISAGTRVVLSLTDGSKLHGVLREFDRDQITIERASDSVTVRKSTIRYIAAN